MVARKVDNPRLVSFTRPPSDGIWCGRCVLSQVRVVHMLNSWASFCRSRALQFLRRWSGATPWRPGSGSITL